MHQTSVATNDIDTILFETFRQSQSNALATDELLQLMEAKCDEPELTAALIRAWQSGKVYVSQVERTQQGYRPVLGCRWSLKSLEGYFGYDPRLGLYQISERLANQLSFTLEATIAIGAPAVCMASSYDREHFAIGDQVGTIWIGKLSTGTILRTLKANRSRVWALSYSSTGEFLASGQQDGTLTLWSSQGEPISSVASRDWVRSLSFSPDGKSLLSGHKRGDPENAVIRLWTVSPLKHVGSFFHHSSTIWSVRYLHDGSGFVSAGRDRTVSCFLFDHDEPLFKEKKHNGTVTCLAIHPFGGVVASGAWTGSIKIWDLETGNDLRTIEAHSLRIYSVAFSPSGRILASGAKDSQIALWLMPDCIPLARVLAHDGWIRGIEFLTDDTMISVGSEGTCKIWRLSPAFPREVEPVSYQSAQDVLNSYRKHLEEEEDDE